VVVTELEELGSSGPSMCSSVSLILDELRSKVRSKDHLLRTWPCVVF